jgi:RNA ligase (TIGR02306 family)
MERKLASIQRVREIRPIEGADSIEIALVNSWQVIVKKGEYNPGDLCIYCEIDSFLPIKPEFEFLRKSSYKKMGDQEGFRLKTVKLRGELSQGLLLPISVLEDEGENKIGISEQPWGSQLQLGPYDNALVIEEGIDVTEIMGIVKYEAPIPASLAGIAKGAFPGFLRKTDEERIQNLTDKYEKLKESTYYVTEKLDGTSGTYYFKDGVFGVCSRNLELQDPGEFVPENILCEDGVERPKKENTYWKVAKELRIEEKLGTLEENFSIQGEIIGESIQGNPYKIKGHQLKIFNVFNIDKQEYLSLDEMVSFLEKVNVDSKPLELVPIIYYDYKLPATIDEVLVQAEGKSVLNINTEREGIVIRNHNKTISFKAISNKFLLKSKD